VCGSGTNGAVLIGMGQVADGLATSVRLKNEGFCCRQGVSFRSPRFGTEVALTINEISSIEAASL
jgi:hypothetical protein